MFLPRQHHSLQALVLASFLSGGCMGSGPGETVGGWQATVDTVGDTITIRTISGSVWSEPASLSPEVQIGEIEGPDEYLFGDPASLAVGEDGTVFVLDVHVPVVRAYDATGAHVSDIGQEGNGPGEYKSPDGMAVLPDGRILVRDPPNARIAVFDSEGSYLEQWPLTGGFNTDIRFFVEPGGQSFSATILERDVQPWDWTFGLVRYSPEGEILDTIPAPTWDYKRPQLTASDGKSSTFRWVPFHATGAWTFSPRGYMVGGLPTTYRIDQFRPDSHVLRVEKDYQPVRVLREESEERRSAITRSLRRRASGWFWNGPPIPEHKPPFKELFSSWEGDIWVVLSTEGVPALSQHEALVEEQITGTRPLRFSEPVLFEVFSSDGRFLGRVQVPDSFRIDPEPIIRGNHVWAVTRDELDIPRVVRFRIVHPAIDQADFRKE